MIKSFVKKRILVCLAIVPTLAVVSCQGTSDFNSHNYSLKIVGKSRYVPENGNNLSKRIKRAEGSRESKGEYSWSGNALVINTDDSDIEYLNSLDPLVSSTGLPQITGRILTAPSEASVVQVNGVSLSNSSEIEAPQSFQRIEYDANGLYGSVIGDSYQSINLTDEYKGVIQPRSITTETFTEDLGFNIARSNVYFINGEFPRYKSADDPFIELNYDYKMDSYTLGNELASYVNGLYIDRSIWDNNLRNQLFNITIDNLSELRTGSVEYAGKPQEADFTIASKNGEFSYSGVFWFELGDYQPADIYKDGQIIQSTSDLGLTDFSEYFDPDADQYYYTENTEKYIREILDKHYEFKTPSGLKAEITSFEMKYREDVGYYPVLTITAENSKELYIADTGDIFKKIDESTLFGDGVFTYYLIKDWQYYYTEPFLVISGFDTDSGYNPHEHDFDLFFDCEQHEVKVDLGNLGEANGNYVYPVKGIENNMNFKVNDQFGIDYYICGNPADTNYTGEYHIDYRGCVYCNDFHINGCIYDSFRKNSYIIFDAAYSNRYWMQNFSSDTAYVFYPKELFTENIPNKLGNLQLWSTNFYTSGTREDLIESVPKDLQKYDWKIKAEDIPDDHFNTTPEYMLEQMAKNNA